MGKAFDDSKRGREKAMNYKSINGYLVTSMPVSGQQWKERDISDLQLVGFQRYLVDHCEEVETSLDGD